MYPTQGTFVPVTANDRSKQEQIALDEQLALAESEGLDLNDNAAILKHLGIKSDSEPTGSDLILSEVKGK